MPRRLNRVHDSLEFLFTYGRSTSKFLWIRVGDKWSWVHVISMQSRSCIQAAGDRTWHGYSTDLCSDSQLFQWYSDWSAWHDVSLTIDNHLMSARDEWAERSCEVPYAALCCSYLGTGTNCTWKYFFAMTSQRRHELETGPCGNLLISTFSLWNKNS